MTVTAESFEFTARGVELGTLPRIELIQISATDISHYSTPGGTISLHDGTAEITITEADMNSALSAIHIDRVSDLKLRTYRDQISISGKHKLGPLAITFSLKGVLQVESGSRLQMADTTLEVACLIPMPAIAANYVRDELNKWLGEMTDTSRMSIPVTYRFVKIEPGRMMVSSHIESIQFAAPPERQIPVC